MIKQIKTVIKSKLTYISNVSEGETKSHFYWNRNNWKKWQKVGAFDSDGISHLFQRLTNIVYH